MQAYLADKRSLFDLGLMPATGPERIGEVSSAENRQMEICKMKLPVEKASNVERQITLLQSPDRNITVKDSYTQNGSGNTCIETCYSYFPRDTSTIHPTLPFLHSSAVLGRRHRPSLVFWDGSQHAVGFEFADGKQLGEFVTAVTGFKICSQLFG
ncbi:hypothetical protein BDZ91DRAFT_362329 [Kalaharituber pfeilii]|nr:hypothetical protein BDZ91DRAFT_362329 [Kalaharituber pfeilii]